jgi:4-amino-4-deoxy-L-arabinose transferase-like glycosyltransferase
VLFTALLLHRTLRRRFGAWPAALAAAFFVASPRRALRRKHRVQPDALALLLVAVAFVAFLAYAEAPGDPSHARRVLGLAVVATALAGLTKPTALHIGVAEAMLLLLIRPRALRRVAPWVAWSLALAVVGAWLLWAAGIHERTGLSFGTVSGGDSKFPAARDLLRPRTLTGDIVRVSLFWGIGLPGAISGGWALAAPSGRAGGVGAARRQRPAPRGVHALLEPRVARLALPPAHDLAWRLAARPRPPAT